MPTSSHPHSDVEYLRPWTTRERGPLADSRDTAGHYVAAGAFVDLPNPWGGRTMSHAEKVRYDAHRVHGFCITIIESYREQQAHGGHRSTYGLCMADVRYAQAVLSWTDYAAALASWGASPDNRAAQARVGTVPAELITEEEKRRLGSKPKPPEVPRPESLTTPPDWPPDPTALDAVADFFAARHPRAGSPQSR